MSTRQSWHYAVMADKDIFDNPQWRQIQFHAATKEMKKVANQLRFPTVKEPVGVYYWEPGKEKPTHLTTLHPKGDTPRKRWRSMVVKLRERMNGDWLTAQTRYVVQYLAHEVTFTIHLVLGPAPRCGPS